MSSFKPLSEQTLMNNYVFSMVIREPGRIRPLLDELKSNEERRQEYMMLMTYGEEQRAAGKYIGLVGQIRRWYEKKLSIPIEDAADYAGITLSQFEGGAFPYQSAS